jgi:transcriptional regulator with XRE-family HTH domain
MATKRSDVLLQQELGRRITQLRSSQDISQADLARRLEITRTLVVKWEAGLHAPSLGQLLRLCRVLKATLDHLLLGRHWQPPRTKGLTRRERDRLHNCVRSLQLVLSKAQAREEEEGDVSGEEMKKA